MIHNLFTTYTGATAAIEILVVVVGSFALGWIARWIYESLETPRLSDLLPHIVLPQIFSRPTPAAVPHRSSASIVMPCKQDDLKIVEGIGPKIESLLQEAGITTWQILADTDSADIKIILRNAGERYRIHDPTTWSEQAHMASAHAWEELKEFQKYLSGGKIIG